MVEYMRGAISVCVFSCPQCGASAISDKTTHEIWPFSEEKVRSRNHHTHCTKCTWKGTLPGSEARIVFLNEFEDQSK